MGKVFDYQGENYEYMPFIDGLLVPNCFRVEMDADADEGPATVHAYFGVGPKHAPVLNVEGDEAIKVEFRAYVQMIHSDSITDAMKNNGIPKGRYRKWKAVDGKPVADGWHYSDVVDAYVAMGIPQTV